MYSDDICVVSNSEVSSYSYQGKKLTGSPFTLHKIGEEVFFTADSDVVYSLYEYNENPVLFLALLAQCMTGTGVMGYLCTGTAR